MAIASERHKAGVRLTLRLRLTLLYGGCFVVAGAALLGITYGLVAHETRAQQSQFVVRGPRVNEVLVPPGALFFSASGTLTIPPGTRLPAGIRSAIAKLPARVRSDGINVQESATGGGGSVSVTVGNKKFRLTSAQARLLVTQQLRSFSTSAQDKINVVTDRANTALRQQRSSSLSSLLTWSGIALAVMALVSIALGWLVAGRALAPMRTMNARARLITAESLHERLGIEGRDDELGELAAAFDELLARLERAFDSQRRFVANASHELRTPLTLERTLVEVALADPDASPESSRRVLERILASTEQQERLIEALLTLARSQAGIEAGTAVDLADIVSEVLLAREARLSAITVRSDLNPAVVTGDEALLERLIANLMDNALLHNAADDPWVQLRTGELDGQPLLVISNNGPAIPPERVDEMFEPFRRLDTDRTSGSAGGLGLGLSIVQAIATAHGATLTTRALDGGGLEIELRFAAVVIAAAEAPVGGLQAAS